MDVASKGEQQDQLKRLVPLNTLSDENLTKLLGQVHIEQAGKGDFLFQEGDTDPQNIYLLSGKVALLLGAKEMDVVSAGTETARFALAHQLPRKYSGRAKTKIEYVRIDSRLLSDLLAQSPQESYRVSDIETELGDDWMSQLLQSRVFQQIPAANIQGVMMRMAEVEVKKGDEIVKQGDEGDYFYLINTGSCSVTHTTGNGGQPVEVARLGPGKSFGEEALLSDQPRSCTITMLSDGKLLRLSKQDFVDLIKRPLSKGLTYPQARTLVDKKDGVWLDVRSPEEYDKAHIRGSVNLPLNTIRIQSASLDSDRQYILYCNNGRQSAAAAYLLTGLDFNVEVLEEGLKEVPAEALENAKATPTATETNPAVQEESEGLAVDDIQEGGANEQPRKQVADLSAVRSVVEKAKAQIATLKKEKQEALAAQQQLQEKLKVLEQQHVDWHNQQESLEKALEEQRQHAKTLENAREEAEAKLQTLLQQQTDKRGDLEQEKGQLATALAEAEQGKSELQAQITALEEAREQQQARLSELENADEALGSTSAELARLKEELAALQAHSEETEVALAESEQAHTELQSRITELEEAHEQQQLRLSELENADEALGSTSAELARLKEELAALQTHSQETETALAESEQAHTELQSRITELEEAHEQQQLRLSELENADEALGSTSAELARLKSELAALQTHSEETEVALAESEQAHTELQSRITELEEDREQQQLRLNELENADEALGSTSAELARLKEELAALQTHSQETETALAESEQAHTELQSRITELEEEREQQQLRLSELENADEALSSTSAELARLQEELQKLSAQLDDSQQQLQHSAEEKAKAQEQTAALTSEIEELRSALKQSEAQLRAAEAGDASEEIASLQAEIDLVRSQAKVELEAAQAELEQAQRKLADSLEKAGTDSTEQEAMRQEMESLRSALDQRQRELDEATKSQRALEDSLEEHHSQLERLKQTLNEAQTEAEETGFQRQEAIDARKQVEEALHRYQQEIEEERAQNAGVLAPQAPAEPLETGSGFALKPLLMGSALGALITFAVLEGVAMVAGQGELFSQLFSEPPAQVVSSSRGDIEKAAPAPESRPAPPEAPRRELPPPVAPVSQQPALPRVLRDRLPGNEVGPVMISISGGSFTMGSTRDQLARDERPAHGVELKPFFMGQYEVTFEEYDAFARTTGRPLPDDQGWGRGSHPVINVTWEDAAAYAKWLSQQTGASYRLPTEAEWEYAAAGGSNDLYWWGFDLGKNRANCFDCSSRWGGSRTAPVGTYEPNGYGLYNTAGNVMEWVQDCYQPSYEGAPTDGSAWEKEGCGQRVLRGGAYNKPGKSMSSTKRGYNSPGVRVPYAGFRLVREP